MNLKKALVGAFAGALVVATVLDLKYKGAGYKMLPESVKSVVDNIF